VMPLGTCDARVAQGEIEALHALTFNGTSEMSPCGQYRYRLTRCWAEPGIALRAVVFIMLNPSTADADRDDPTVRRCLTIARREGANMLAVGNLFGLRAASPDRLTQVADPFGPCNAAALTALASFAAAHHAPIICAWGTRGVFSGAHRLALDMIGSGSAPLVCLGLTKNGQPRHPLYVPPTKPLVPYSPQRA
jgi:hypothetical protein